MKPVCKAESRWLYWRTENPKPYSRDKFSQWAKKQMIKARRKHFKDELREHMYPEKKQNDVYSLAAEQLEEAAGLIEDWGSYASPYFKEKHNLQGDIKKILSYAKSIRNKITEQT